MSPVFGTVSRRFDTDGFCQILHLHTTKINNVVRTFLARKVLKQLRFQKRRNDDHIYGNKMRAIKQYVKEQRQKGIHAVFHRAYQKYVQKWKNQMKTISLYSTVQYIPSILNSSIQSEYARQCHIEKVRVLKREMVLMNMVATRLQCRYRARLERARMYERRRVEQLSKNELTEPPLCVGWKFSAVLSPSTGDMYACGMSKATGIARMSMILVRIPRLSNLLYKITQVACGADHLLCLTSSYTVLALGSNTQHQLGQPLPRNRNNNNRNDVKVKVEDIQDAVEPMSGKYNMLHSNISSMMMRYFVDEFSVLYTHHDCLFFFSLCTIRYMFI